MAFQFGQSPDPGSLRNAFMEHGYVQVTSVLREDDARQVHQALLEKTPWNLVFHDGEKHVDLSSEQIGKLDHASLNRLQHSIFNQARTGFQYSYHSYPIYDAVKAGINEGHLLHDLYEWMNGEEFLSFARRITGYDDITFVDAQATRYGPGHFLTTHDDVQEGKNRRAAYVLNLTPDWRADWGGYLQLLDDNDNARAGLVPTFNALNVIAIPQRHNVSFVTPFAGGFRFAVTGWFRSEGD